MFLRFCFSGESLKFLLVLRDNFRGFGRTRRTSRGGSGVPTEALGSKVSSELQWSCRLGQSSAGVCRTPSPPGVLLLSWTWNQTPVWTWIWAQIRVSSIGQSGPWCRPVRVRVKVHMLNQPGPVSAAGPLQPGHLRTTGWTTGSEPSQHTQNQIKS